MTDPYIARALLLAEPEPARGKRVDQVRAREGVNRPTTSEAVAEGAVGLLGDCLALASWPPLSRLARPHDPADVAHWAAKLGREG